MKAIYKSITVEFDTSWMLEHGIEHHVLMDLAELIIDKYGERVNYVGENTICISAYEEEPLDKVEVYVELLKTLGIKESDEALKNIISISVKEYEGEPKNHEGDKESDETPLFSDEEIDGMLESILGEIGKKPKKEKKKTENEITSIDELSEKYDNLYNLMTKRVLGQDMAIMQYVRECFQSELIRVEGKKGPKATFLFAGPPGVGKTFLADTAAEYMGVESKLFNMSGYADDKSYIDLVGLSKSFKDPREGELVKFARENPNGIIIFDEIEKAHITTIRLFLQVLDRGVLHNDYLEEDTDFSGNTLIFTSNVGKALYADRDKNLSTLPKEVVLDALCNEKNDYGRTVFPPELCSRFGAGNIVVFNHMSIHTLLELVRRQFRIVSDNLEHTYKYTMSYDCNLPLLFLLNLGAKADARVVSGQGVKFLSNEVYELARHILPVDKKMSDYKEISFELSYDMPDDIAALFKSNHKMEILVLGKADYKNKIDIQDKRYSVIFADNIDQAKEALDRDISMILVDPFYEMKMDNESVLGIDDYNSTGIEFVNFLMETDVEIPVYLISDEKIISTIDQGVFLQRGIRDFVMGENLTSKDLSNSIFEFAENIRLQKQFTEFTNKGLIVAYETAQIIVEEENKLVVRFYGLKKKTAIDAESQKKIISNAERPTTKLSDIIGAENAKEELKYFINYLKNPKQFVLNGGKKPKGILLYGPPGTGKTMLARAMAGETSMTFISTSATELMSKYVGEGEKNIRDLFATAKRYAPSIIFIDEIDAIGKKRTGAENARSSENMLNALLTEMDGFATGGIKHPVFVLAATNYGVNEGDKSVALDPALVRRFDNKIYVDLPKEEERKQYLDLKLLNKDNEVTEEAISNLAKRTTGKSLAILENVIDLAKRNALKASKPLDDHILQAALEEYNYGEQHKWDDDYYRKVAIHEASHAYICYLSGETPSYVTIVSRGDFGGYMQHDNGEKQPNRTRTDLLWNIKTSLAGRIGEKVFFGEEVAINTGASSDLEHASRLALNMICSLGMGEGQLFALSPEDLLKTSLAGEYIGKANALLNEQYAECEKLVDAGKDKIQALADKLIKDNYMTGDELVNILK